MTDPEQTPAPEPEAEPTPDPKPADPDGGTYDEERALATIRNQREAEKKLKAELREARELAEKWKQHEADQLSEQEKAQQRAAAAEAKEQEATNALRRAYLLTELAKPEHGIVDAEAAADLIRGVEYGDDNKPANLSEILGDFLNAKSYLKGTPSKPKPPSLNGGDDHEAPKPDLTAAELAAAERYGMTVEEYAVFKTGGSLADLTAAGLKQD